MRTQRCNMASDEWRYADIISHIPNAKVITLLRNPMQEIHSQLEHDIRSAANRNPRTYRYKNVRDSLKKNFPFHAKVITLCFAPLLSKVTVIYLHSEKIPLPKLMGDVTADTSAICSSTKSSSQSSRLKCLDSATALFFRFPTRGVTLFAVSDTRDTSIAKNLAQYWQSLRCDGRFVATNMRSWSIEHTPVISGGADRINMLLWVKKKEVVGRHVRFQETSRAAVFFIGAYEREGAARDTNAASPPSQNAEKTPLRKVGVYDFQACKKSPTEVE